ncbi:MAG: PQQ-dependent dehydrogenase, methanol/ethanol family [Bryobacterales bacterium]|nr:PQQ-dependent dehydrogenase, methanol/ethanol family [Bryobacterales bacterium]
MVLLLLLAMLGPLWAQEESARVFSARCSFCHGADGLGGERGPRIRSDRGDLAKLIREGAGTMPPMQLSDVEMDQVRLFVRRLLRSNSMADLPAGPIVPSKGPKQDWPFYHGQLSGNRHSTLRLINTSNVQQLAPRWMFNVTSPGLHEATPIVSDGVMFLAAVNEVIAVDPRDGRQIWRYRRSRTAGLVGDTSSGINRGVSLDATRVYTVTDNAHVLALDRKTGKLLWDSTMADIKENYGSTSPPLVVGNVVIAGVSGGDEGVRGFLDAFEASSGKHLWRFWTVPAPGEPGSETWQGRDIAHGCAATWFTGTYDPEAKLVYWPTGNPCPDYDGDERKGDNLYSNSVVALHPETGKLAWYFQYTPHDLHDWDSVQVPMLVDMNWKGKPRKLLMQGNRNGYFYVLDRLTGEFLQGTPFVSKLSWSDGIDGKGRPMVRADATPTKEGVRACPAVEGATNWFSTAWHPGTQLFYLMALEKCTIFTKTGGKWESGKSFYNGDTRNVPNEPGKKFLRALDPNTGKVVWEVPQTGQGRTWGGVLSTDGGLVFYGADNGDFAAVDAKSGKPLWRFPANANWKASPMTYMIDGKQYVAVQAGPTVLVFGLP